MRKNTSFLAMEPSNQTFKALMGNSVKYNVPHFQRDYSWDKEQWEELWEDIENLNEEERHEEEQHEEEQHYMGYIVLQRNEKDKNNFVIIDGQQRLITLSLLILSAMHKIQNLPNDNENTEDNKIRLNEIRRGFIGTLSPTTLAPYNKLVLTVRSINLAIFKPESWVIFLQKNSKQSDINLSVLVKFLLTRGCKSSVSFLNLVLLFLFKTSLL
jgi:hypothetical protein